jgi:hypothetical protein
VAAGTERRKKRDAAFVAIMVDLSMIVCTYSMEHEQVKTIDDPSSARSVGCIGSCEEAATQDGAKRRR